MIRKVVATAMMLTVFSAASAFAAPWSGAATNFSYASTAGGDGGTMFSAPTAFGNSLLFNTPGFSAESIAGTPGSESGYVEFEINIQPGYSLDFVSAAVAGTINVVGQDSWVDLGVTWEVRDDVLNASLNQTISATSPITFPHTFLGNPSADNATFSGDNTLGGIGSQLPAWGQVLVVKLDIGILAESTSGSASIDLFASGMELGFFFVPEPTTATLILLTGGLALIRRRR